MKLQQLKYLIAIVDNGLNITAAAERLYTSQPGVSKQLKLLEEELGFDIGVEAFGPLGPATFPSAGVVGERYALRSPADMAGYLVEHGYDLKQLLAHGSNSIRRGDANDEHTRDSRLGGLEKAFVRPVHGLTQIDDL